MKNRLQILIIFLLSINSFSLFCQTKNEKSIQTFRLGGLTNIIEGLDIKDANAAFKLLVNAFVKDLDKRKRNKFILEQKVYESEAELKKDIDNKTVSYFHSSSNVYYNLNQKKDFVPFLTGCTTKGNKFIKFFLVTGEKNNYSKPKDLIDQKIALTKKTKDEIGYYWLKSHVRERLTSKEFISIEFQTVKQNEAELLLSVFFGKNKYALVSETTYDLAVELNPSLKTKLKIVEKSGALIGGVFAYRKNTDVEYLKTITDVAINLHNENSGKQILDLFKISELADLSETDLKETENIINKYNKYFK